MPSHEPSRRPTSDEPNIICGYNVQQNSQITLAPLHEIVVESDDTATAFSEIPKHQRTDSVRMLEDIAEVLRDPNILGFEPILLELSYLRYPIDSPESPSTYVAMVYAPEPLAHAYQHLMGENLSDETSPDIGPLIPSPALYHHSHWLLYTELPFAAERFDQFKSLAWDVQLSSYIATHPSASDDPQVVRKFLMSFHRRVAAATRSLGIEFSPDLLAVPFPSGHSQSKAQGGAILAVGRLVQRRYIEEPVAGRVELLERLSSVSNLFVRAVADESTRRADLARFTADRSREELILTYLRRGAIHETRVFANILAGIISAQKHSATDAESIQLMSDAEAVIQGFRTIIDVLSQPTASTDTEVDLSDATALAITFMSHLSQLSPAFMDDYRRRGQDENSIKEFLFTNSDQQLDLTDTIRRISGPRGRCAVAIRNLVDNAFKGAGDHWDDNGHCHNYRQPRESEVSICHTATRLEILNSAILPRETYQSSWQYDEFRQPIGVFIPSSVRRTAKDPLTSKEHEISLKGGRLAQVLLNYLGFRVRFEPYVVSGRHCGTLTIVERDVRVLDEAYQSRFI